MAIRRESVFTYHILQDRERKNLAILELIKKRGPISRAEISKLLGINIVTISNYIDFYINKRLILEVGLDVSSGGRRPELLELNAKNGYVVGVDISPEHITTVVTDLKLNVISKARVVRPAVSMEDLISEIINIIDEVITKSKIESAKIKDIGIGISGIVDYPSGTIRDTDPTRGRTKTNFLKFTKIIEQRFDIPVYIGNDASCAAFGEKLLNPSADVDNLLYVYSDVGLGIVIQGDVYWGSSGCAGEVQLAFNGLQSDEKHYVEEYKHMRPWGADLGIVLAARKAIGKGVATEILKSASGKLENINKDIIIEAARKKDKLAIEVIDTAGKNLGIRVAYLVNIFNPEVVIIGGGIEKTGDIFLDPIKSMAKKFGFEEPSSIIKVIPSFLGEEAVVLGAAALATRELFMQV